MSELEDLVAVLGAVDEAVVDGTVAAEQIAPLLHAYDDGAAGWFRSFVDFMAATTGADPASLPDVRTALEDLASIDPRGRLASKRLLAIAALSRAFPDEVAPGGGLHDLAAAALMVRGLADDEDGAVDLLRRLGVEGDLPGLGAWAEFLDIAFENGLVTAEVKDQKVPPCSGTLTTVTLDTDTDPVTQMVTHFCTDQVTLAQITPFLDPANWPNCSDFWCSMTELSKGEQGQRRFLEVVSSGCPDGYFTFRTCLQFWASNLPNGVSLEYDLCSGPCPPDEDCGDGIITVDQGSIVAVQNGTELCITTTKRARFTAPFDGAHLAMWACAMGWASYAEDMIFSCALGSGAAGQQGGAGEQWQTTENTGGKKEGGTVADKGRAKAEANGGDLEPVVADAVEAAKKCLEECASVYNEAYKKAQAGAYGADDLVKDAAAMAQRMLRDAATMVDLGTRFARSAAAAARPDEG